MKKIKIPFWDLNVNPITMWKNLKPPKKEPILNAKTNIGDQASIFKPKGFR